MGYLQNNFINKLIQERGDFKEFFYLASDSRKYGDRKENIVWLSEKRPRIQE
jgi:hypothetical protein